jgi:hypothetical protein
MIDNMQPLMWKEIAKERAPEELPFLYLFDELTTAEDPDQG